MIRIYNPTERRTECRVVEIDGVELCFSYKTLVGAMFSDRAYRLENKWGSTTGRHINEMGLRNAAIVTAEQLQNLVSTELMCLGYGEREQDAA